MADDKKDATLALLFGQEGMTLENIKFFRGDRDVISEEELCAQVHSGLMQMRMGKADVSDSFLEESATVDVREFILTI